MSCGNPHSPGSSEPSKASGLKADRVSRSRPNRPISDSEKAVVRVMLEKALVEPDAANLKTTLDALRVVGICGCGCASVDFIRSDSERRSKPIADGSGETTAGGTVGIIVWGTPHEVTGLEVYDLGAGDADLSLPRLDTIAPLSGAG